MSLAGNVTARLVALASLLLSTLVIARADGPAAVGIYALLHVLPGVVALIASCGLTVAIPYFLAPPRGRDPHLPLTIVAIVVLGGGAGALLWAAAAPHIAAGLFPGLAAWLVAVAGLAVLTRLIVVTAKSCSQGGDDMRGANRVIAGEELAFLPAYAAVSLAGAGGATAIVLALLLADVVTGTLAWARLLRRGFLAGAERPSRSLARELAGYGARAQVGGLITQLNLRLDFVLLAALTGPAVLGIYAIASKFAELLRIVTMAITYVLYPAYARDGRARAYASARRLLPRAGALTAGAAIVLWLAAGFVIPAIYGPAFDGAVTPARIILLGLALEGVAAVVTAFLYGTGRPGLSSIAMAGGLAVTVALDVALIPTFEAVGAAIASAVAYATVSLALIWMFARAGRTEPGRRWKTSEWSRAEAR